MIAANKAIPIISVCKVGDMAKNPMPISMALVNIEHLFMSIPCSPAERLITPIQAVIKALMVRDKGTPSVLPINKTGLFKKKKGIINPVSPSLTAIIDVFV